MGERQVLAGGVELGSGDLSICHRGIDLIAQPAALIPQVCDDEQHECAEQDSRKIVGQGHGLRQSHARRRQEEQQKRYDQGHRHDH